jgi:hypothetical protein
MSEQQLQYFSQDIFAEFTNLGQLTSPDRPLHLAHYTSLEVLEKIMITDEIWFSNPLVMNDYTEVSRGLSEATRIAERLKTDSSLLLILKDQQMLDNILGSFAAELQIFHINHLNRHSRNTLSLTRYGML